MARRPPLPPPPAFLPPLHLRSATPAVLPRPFVLEVGSCWVGVPRGRGPPAPLGREGTLASPPAPAFPSRVPLVPGPLSASQCLLFDPESPSARSQAFAVCLPASLPISPPLRGLREEGGRGRREEEEKPRCHRGTENPRGHFQAASPGTRCRGRGFPAPPQGGGPAPAGKPPGQRPRRAARGPAGAQPSPPLQPGESPARRGLKVRT